MTREIQEKLAGSLTAETTKLLPFLPYLLQDFWELGSNPNAVVELIEKYIDISENTKVLDLACGKGAVSVTIARELGLRVKGIDLLPDFIEVAVQKAAEFNVCNLCEFVVADINEAIKMEENYDVVIFCSAGNVLGNPAETLSKLKATVKTGGYILIDECYLANDRKQGDVLYNNYEYFTEEQWGVLFREAGLKLINTFSGCCPENPDSDSDMAAIATRANELIEKHPDEKAIFEGYIHSQQKEYDDIDSCLVGVVWILKVL